MSLLPEHADTFAERLEEALNFQGEGESTSWECNGDLRRTRRIFAEMGFNAERVESLVKEFPSQGGCCDCEVMFNVACVHYCPEDA
jgi:hypothetical protein